MEVWLLRVKGELECHVEFVTFGPARFRMRLIWRSRLKLLASQLPSCRTCNNSTQYPRRASAFPTQTIIKSTRRLATGFSMICDLDQRMSAALARPASPRRQPCGCILPQPTAACMLHCRNARCPVDGQEKQTRTADAVGSPELLFWSFVFLLSQRLSALVSPWQFRSYSTYLTDTHCPPINDFSAKCMQSLTCGCAKINQ